MATLICNNEQLKLIQDALELYSRIGILQLDHIIYHPFIKNMLYNQFRPKKSKLEVGDETERGTIVEIGENYIKTKSYWSDWKDRATLEMLQQYEIDNKWPEEIRTWYDIDNIKLSIDYNKYHAAKDKLVDLCSELKNLISGDPQISNKHASYGIGRTNEGQYNIDAYDMIQVIRHEFWKENPNRSNITVDSSICKFGNKKLIKVKLDEKE